MANFIQKNKCESSECKVCNFAMYFASQSLYCNEKDPCKPRWRLSVQKLQLADFIFDRQENKKESANISKKIAESIWEHTE